MIPETNYVKNGDVHIAYQAVGSEQRDLVYLAGIFSHIELQWENALYERYLTRLSSFTRLIMMDMRGVGLSDRTDRLPLLEDQMDDLSVVLDRVGSNRAGVFGVSQAGPMAVVYTAANPQRVDALILYAAYASAQRRDDYPWGRDRSWLDGYIRQLDDLWGKASFLPQTAPSLADDGEFRNWWGRFERYSSSPGNAVAYARAHIEDDVRSLLSTVSVPTLVIQRADDSYRDAGQGRYIADQIPDAEYAELPGRDHLPYVGDQDAIVDEVEEFLTGVRSAPAIDRVLATVLFTDIVDSTRLAASLGDSDWLVLLERHNTAIRIQVASYGGRLIGTMGDGVLATFSGPARAIRCAISIRRVVADLGLDVRQGIHTGEVEITGDDVAGLGVHIGARIAALGGEDQILVSRTVRDLVAGSGVRFENRGAHELKGVPDQWEVFAVVGDDAPAR
jgi:class 3 adenylate cyclase